MNASERNQLTGDEVAPPSDNHYSPLRDLLPYLREGNGIEAEIASQTQEGTEPKAAVVEVTSSIVGGFETGAMLSKPGEHHRRGLRVKPPLNSKMRQGGIPEETIWVERMIANTFSPKSADELPSNSHIDSYPRVKIVKKVA